MAKKTKQQAEIATIKERSITLSLSDADVLRICKIAGAVNMTPQELLQSFVGDLVDGTYSNGSDERMYANTWFARCGFSHTAEQTLVRYLLETDGIWEFFSYMLDLEMHRSELVQLEASLDKGDFELKKIASLKEFISNSQETLKYEFSNFEEWCDKAEEWCSIKTTHGTFEEELKKVSAWVKTYEQLACPLSADEEDPCSEPQLKSVVDAFALEF